MHWIWYHAGLNSGNSPWYLFPSGWGGILLVSGSFLSMPYVTWKRNNCHEPRCWRIGRLPVEGTPWHVCRKHHPSPPQQGDILKHHRLYLGQKPGRG